MFEDIKKLYDCLADEESKKIFRHRLLYSLTGDRNHMKDMLLSYRRENKGYYDLLDVLAEPSMFRGFKEVILFGAGDWGICIADWLAWLNIEYHYHCDNDVNKVGKTFLGKKIISAAELFAEHKDALLFIASEKYESEILQQLRENSFPESRIIRLAYTVSKEKEYIDDSIVRPSENEVYVDAGCFDGTNSIEFVEWAGGSVEKIYAFEPNEKNYKKCEINLREKCKVDYEIIQAGLWSEKTVLSFEEFGSGSNINNKGKVEIAVTSLDEMLGDDKVTFIKMDIEGAELEALKGAQQIIRKHKPRLAICLYHKPEDVLDIPLYIKELVPEYKLYIRHYYPYLFDTVLYAVIE